jgi:hypothetical protein
MKRVLFSLVVNGVSDNGERRTATRSNEVGRRPQNATPLTASYLWPQLSQAALDTPLSELTSLKSATFGG